MNKGKRHPQSWTASPASLSAWRYASVPNCLGVPRSLPLDQRLFITLVVAALFLLSGSLLVAAPVVDFNREIRPLLSNRCFACHGPDEAERKAGLRLDTREGALALLDQSAAIVPGAPESSELLSRISLPHDSPDLMPPSGKGLPFTSEEQQLIRLWIEQQAPYARHWSYDKPRAVPLPVVNDVNWPLHPLDYFILHRLEAEGLSPAEAATREILARRLSLDLIGLPPQWDDVSAFVNDHSPQAYDTYVDRLLEHPGFGERWARMWLDLARYADSAGYADDPPRTIWAYRDYVVRALNANKPYDVFTIEQLAGDLLPSPTEDQLIATAFHRNTPTNNEGGTIDEEFRNVAVVDRVNTTMAVWMGTTMACAQCHTHKYDPLTHEDYFRLFAIFNQSADADRKDEHPIHRIWTKEQQEEHEQREQRLQELRKIIVTPTAATQAEQQQWEAHFNSDPSWVALVPSRLASEAGKPLAHEGALISLQGERAQKDDYTLEYPLSGPEISLAALQLKTDAAQTSNFVLSGLKVKWLPDRPEVITGRYLRVTLPGKQRWLHLAEVKVYANGVNVAPSGTASQSSTYAGAVAALAIDDSTDGRYDARSVSHTLQEDAPWWEIDLGTSLPIEKVELWNRTDSDLEKRLQGYELVVLDEERNPVWHTRPAHVPSPSLEWDLDGSRELAFTSPRASHEQPGFAAKTIFEKEAKKGDPHSQGWAIAGGEGTEQQLLLVSPEPISLKGGKLRITMRQQSRFDSHVLTHFSWLLSQDPRVSLWADTPENIREILLRPPHSRRPRDTQDLERYFLQIASPLHEARAEIAQLEGLQKNMKPITEVPVMRELPKEQHRQTFVHLRGEYLSHGPQVEPGVPAVFPPLQTTTPPDRLDLARWLMSPENPLTARVTVNRFWEELFGIGIVATSEEFGSQGEAPSHPELLDWLALDFMKSGWDIKALLKKIVTSATYRQSSAARPGIEASDPDNRLLARGPRFRVPAETVRDQALAISGLLSHKQLGPPVKPPQPETGLRAAFGGATDWETSQGEDRWRRALYTHWRRSNPYPSMATFGAPNREVCTVRRARTNTPLQALVTLNDPVYVEAAQALGRRMATAARGAAETGVAFGFRETLSREGSFNEISRLAGLHRELEAHYSHSPEAAVALSENPLGPLPPGMAHHELAAWTAVANVLLNLDELFMKR